MKIWLDDIRPAPNETFTICKTVNEALILFERWLQHGEEKIEFISFDHDLGDKFDTGYTLAKLIEQWAFLGLCPRIEYNIHSANPPGRNNILMAMENAKKFWDLIDFELDKISLDELRKRIKQDDYGR